MQKEFAKYMMQWNRYKLVNLIFGALLLTTLVNIVFSDLFKVSDSSIAKFSNIQTLLRKDDISKIDQMVLITRFGEFNLKKMDGQWRLTAPQDTLADTYNVQKILNIMTELKVKNIQSKDYLNEKNYSINSPLCEIKIKSPQMSEWSHYKLGLINPIDNSSYMSLENENVIFHLEGNSKFLSNLELSSFITTHLINMAREEIKQVEIFRGSSQSPSLTLTKDATTLKVNGKNNIDPKIISRYLDKLLKIKSSIVVDRPDQDQKEEIRSIMSSPNFTLNITSTTDKNIKVFVGPVIYSFPNINFNGRQFFPVKLAGHDQILLVSKDSYYLMKVNSDDLKFETNEDSN